MNSPICAMLKDYNSSFFFWKFKRSRTQIFNICSYFDIYECSVKFMEFHELSKVVSPVYEYFPPPLVISLSVVSMEPLSPDKMAEIRPRTWQQGAPGPKHWVGQDF